MNMCPACNRDLSHGNENITCIRCECRCCAINLRGNFYFFDVNDFMSDDSKSDPIKLFFCDDYKCFNFKNLLSDHMKMLRNLRCLSKSFSKYIEKLPKNLPVIFYFNNWWSDEIEYNYLENQAEENIYMFVTWLTGFEYFTSESQFIL